MLVTSTLHPSPAGDAGGERPDPHAVGHPSGPAQPQRSGVLAGPGAGVGYAYPPAYVYAQPGRIGSFFQRLGQRLPEWTAPAGVAVCAAAGVGYTLFMDPTSADAESRPTCIMKLFTGFDCPGCGGTRAAWYLLHGNVAAAARHHAPLVFATPFLLYVYVAWTLGLVTKRKLLPQLRVPNTVLVGFMGAWIVFSVVRNLPWAPFTWLYV
jgi:hypothetical protein